MPLGRQDFLDDQERFPGKEKSERQAGENEQAIRCSLQQFDSEVWNGTRDSYVFGFAAAKKWNWWLLPVV